jgi:hypothetical protein
MIGGPNLDVDADRTKPVEVWQSQELSVEDAECAAGPNDLVARPPQRAVHLAGKREHQDHVNGNAEYEDDRSQDSRIVEGEA